MEDIKNYVYIIWLIKMELIKYIGLNLIARESIKFMGEKEDEHCY